MSDIASRYATRNFRLGVINGVIFMAGSLLLRPETIIPQFLGGIFESKAAIGLGSCLLWMGWSVPQVVTAYFARSFQYRKPLYIRANVTRMTLIGIFILSMIVFRNSPRTIGLLYFVLMGLAGLAAGAVGLAYQDIVARVVPSTRLGAYNAYRIIGGQGLLAIASGFFCKYILDHPETFPYPWNYLTMFTLSWFMMSTGVVFFSFVKEPPDVPKRRPRPSMYILELYLIVKNNRDYRLFLFQKLLRAFEWLAVPYYVLYATKVLKLPESVAGTFLITGVLTMAVVPVIWGRISDRRGNRAVITASSAVAALAPLVGLAVVIMGWTGALRAGTTATVMMMPIFVLLAVAGAGAQIGFMNYVMESAPLRRRPVYLGLTTTIDGLLTLILPAVGGLLIDVIDYWVAFAVAAVFVSASVAMSLRLAEPRKTATAASPLPPGEGQGEGERP
jgi:MFS family permease